MKTNPGHGVAAWQPLSPVLCITLSHTATRHTPLGDALWVQEHKWVKAPHFES